MLILRVLTLCSLLGWYQSSGEKKHTVLRIYGEKWRLCFPPKRW
jgi:hypothetical protein